jgi:peptidoglycan hydrolase-like protein with peptidoglycan-binding domain
VIGSFWPDLAMALKPLSTVFLRMIKSIIVPLIFGTLVVGIAGHGDDMKRVGRLALKSIIYFEIVTTLALAIGLLAVNLVRPGDGVTLTASAEAGKELAHNTQTGTSFLEHLVPTSFFDAAARNEVLQIVFFAVLFAVALSKVQGRSKEVVLAACEGLADVMFKFTLIVMRFAPFGIGAAIAGAGSQNASSSNILSALGALLSEGRNVSVPSGTQLAVQLEQSVSLRGRQGQRSDLSLLTSSDMIRAAQTELARQNYYRGTIDGQMTYATQRAVFEYQTDHSLTATGNLDWRTARALGLSGTVGSGTTTNPSSAGYALSAADATTIRRNAQSLAAAERQNLSIGTASRYNSRYGPADIDLWFALSAFADNASLYEQLTRMGTSTDASIANQSLIAAARRVDTALQAARPTNAVRSSWQSIRNQLHNLDSTFY